ncbi:MAG: hypothetical protein WB983_05550 [Terriglobales bacterium]
MNPIDWLAWIYGKFFYGHPWLGYFVAVVVLAIPFLLLWLRAVDKYEETHPKMMAATAPSSVSPPVAASDVGQTQSPSKMPPKKTPPKEPPAPAVQANAPNGIAIVGGIVSNPTVNNFAPADRTLSDSQKTSISEAAQIVPAEVTIVVEHAADQESSDYAKQIRDAISLGHAASLATALSYGGQPPPKGLYVLAHTDDDKVLPSANHFYDVIKKSGVRCEAYQVDWVPSGVIRISVGVRPPE